MRRNDGVNGPKKGPLCGQSGEVRFAASQTTEQNCGTIIVISWRVRGQNYRRMSP